MFEDILLFIFKILWLGMAVFFGWAGVLLIDQGAAVSAVITFIAAFLSYALSQN